ncbi:MAG: excinuclease ABC subunit UvrC, partial [Candidatus Izemoplasmatales bacterium]|nr:excinuclease ABC subunit UvrC [Candidatus Izemoplasmatales bacterium]
EKTLEKQQVIFADMKDRDILSYYAYDDYMAVTTLFMRQGKITFSESQLHPLQGMVEEAFLSYLGQYYQNKPLPQEILLPEGIEVGFLEEWLGKKIIIPKKGAKKALITMATENAQIHLQNNLDKFLKKHDKTIGATEELGRLLGIEAPRRIDTFDNSNTMGKNPVSAMVVFINGLPSKKDYRKYIVKTVEGADDYHTMQEVLYRRYQRMLMEQTDRPDLIVMDGGIHQVNAAKEILNSLYLDIPIIGLKKDDKHRTESIVTSDHREFELDKHSNLFFLLSKIQEEVHRFAITFHRSKQSKDLFASMLDAVPGIGKQTRQRLLMRFKTLEGIKNASFEEWKEAGLNKNQIEALSIAFQKSNG